MTASALAVPRNMRVVIPVAAIGAVIAAALAWFVFIPMIRDARVLNQRLACQSNLLTFTRAKEAWYNEHQVAPEVAPDMEDLKPYIEIYFYPMCPADGVYTMNDRNTSPTCSIPSHTYPTTDVILRP